MTDARPCATCMHQRAPLPPDPFAGVALASKKVAELRTKWRQELLSRARVEYQKLEAGEPFGFEPISMEWCEHYSSSGADGVVFVPCVRQNPNDDCADHRPVTT